MGSSTRLISVAVPAIPELTNWWMVVVVDVGVRIAVVGAGNGSQPGMVVFRGEIFRSVRVSIKILLVLLLFFLFTCRGRFRIITPLPRRVYSLPSSRLYYYH